MTDPITKAVAATGPSTGLTHVVRLWRAGNGGQRSAAARYFPALADALTQADEYMSDVEGRKPIQDPVATDPGLACIRVVADLLQAAGPPQASLYGPRDWLNLALSYAAKAASEPAPEWVDAYSGLSRVWAHLAEAAVVVAKSEATAPTAPTAPAS